MIAPDASDDADDAPAARQRAAARPRRAYRPPLRIWLLDADALTAARADWESLVAAASEPNVFYEPWMLLPALRAFGNPTLRFACVVDAEGRWCALFPLASQPRFRGLPIASQSLWRHPYCFSCRPLVRAGVERPAMAAFLAWLDDTSDRPALIELPFLPARGRVHDAIVGGLDERAVAVELSSRGFLERDVDGDAGIQRVLSGARRRDLHRRERRLSTGGPVRYRELSRDDELPGWIDAFLMLEASGWKGAAGSALASSAPARGFFDEIVRAAFVRQRLFMSALFIGDEPVGMLAGFVDGDGMIAFKSAMSERHARHSPGTLVLVHVLERFYQLPPAIRWLDSCSSPSSSMTALFADRLPMQNVIFAAGPRRAAELAVAALPLLRLGARGLRRFVGAPKI